MAAAAPAWSRLPAHRYDLNDTLVSKNRRWSVIIDCGSSGSRARIYQVGFSGAVAEFLPKDAADQALLDVSPGISSFRSNPNGVTVYFEALLAQVARLTGGAAEAQALLRAAQSHTHTPRTHYVYHSSHSYAYPLIHTHSYVYHASHVYA